MCHGTTSDSDSLPAKAGLKSQKTQNAPVLHDDVKKKWIKCVEIAARCCVKNGKTGQELIFILICLNLRKFK
jgi:hypothetical protein